MCGLAGFCDFGYQSNDDILKAMTDSLAYRGPNDCGYNVWNSNSYQVGFGHRRLSILDLSPLGHQPMHFEQFHIVLNGEIYNYKDIRITLLSKGYTFNSNSDTEVVLKAFHCWGVKAPERFIGMFAFAIYDDSLHKIYLFRDRAGVKPLYYYWNNNVLLFSSELKAFHKHPAFRKKINTDSLAQFFRFGYIHAPLAIFENCFKVPSGTFIEFDIHTKHLKTVKYWDVLDYYSLNDNQLSEDEVLENLESLLKSSFEYRMVSDVPVGIFLSGGYDSTLVAAILQKNRTEKLKTFTIGFDNVLYNEAPYAKAIAKYIGTEHTEYYCTEKEAQEIIPGLSSIYDEPFGDSSAIPTILVSKFARKDVTVALSADGGDEIFAGYNAYELALKYHKTIGRIPSFIKNAASEVLNGISPSRIPFSTSLYNFETRYNKASLLLKTKTPQHILSVMYSNFTKKELGKLLNNTSINYYGSLYDCFNNIGDKINAMLANDYKGYMCDDILVKVDRATMSVSLEGREPLLDHRIIEFIASLPGGLKFKNNTKKYLLKTLTHKYVPENLLNRPKKGFSVPMEQWFRAGLSFYVDQYLSKKAVAAGEILNPGYVEELVAKFKGSKTASFQKLWFILMFQMWSEKWL